MEIATIVFFSLIIILGIIILSAKITANNTCKFCRIVLIIAFKLGTAYILAGAIWQLGKILGIFL